MFNASAFKRVYEGSGLSKGELAILYGVTRQTIYNWLRGGTPTQAFVVQHADEMSRVVGVMLDQQLLPFSQSLNKEKRARRLNTMLQQVHKIVRPKTT